MAANPNVSTVWLKDGGQYAYRRSLTGTIGTEKTKDFSFVDSEGNSIDCLVVVEAFMYVLSYQKFFRNMSFPSA